MVNFILSFVNYTEKKGWTQTPAKLKLLSLTLSECSRLLFVSWYYIPRDDVLSCTPVLRAILHYHSLKKFPLNISTLSVGTTI